MFDNGNYSAQYTGTNISRAVEYELDTNLMTATKVWEFVHPDSLYSPSISGVQRLPNGNTLIDFGNLQWLNLGSIVTEVDANNQIDFQLEYDNGGNLYRAQKFDWFFYTAPTPSWNCVAGSCIDSGTGNGIYASLSDCQASCGTTEVEEQTTNKELLKITDLLGRETKATNQLLFYLYNDGTVEKKVVID